jgi:hypothetical protein
MLPAHASVTSVSCTAAISSVCSCVLTKHVLEVRQLCQLRAFTIYSVTYVPIYALMMS